MESFFSRYKNALVLILVLFAQVIGVAMQVRRPLSREHGQPDAGGVRLIRYWAISLVSPPERLVHWLGSSILNLWDNYLDLVHVRQQNKDLQAELHRLRLEQGGIVEDARQGQRLQKLLAFQEKYLYKTVPAQVIGTSGTEQSRILSIDKGAKDGLAVDMPVITPDGIVGRIREVFPHTSQVLEISDPTSGAGVILATTRVRGILRGNALGQPQVVNVMPDERIKAGEQVVTSGGDQIFPRGLAVGTVDSVATDPDRDPLVDVLIRPAANLSQLEEVLVITNTGDELPPRAKLDLIQSQAAASAEQLRASEVLAERLPSRIDPDAPKADDDSADDNEASADGGVARPLRPPAPLRPDRFSPNITLPAMSLTPGARVAAQSEGPGNSTASVPKPHVAAPDDDASDSAAATPAPVKKPELVPDDGSRPPAVLEPAEVPREAVVPHHVPIPATGLPSGNGRTTTPLHNDNAPPAVTRPPKTTVVVDGPLPVKKTTPSAAPPRPASTPVTSPAATTPRATTPRTTTPRATTPGAASPTAQHPATNQHPATTTPGQPKPTATPVQRRTPQLVPDDGSRPPATTRPKPQQPATPPPQGGPQP